MTTFLIVWLVKFVILLIGAAFGFHYAKQEREEKQPARQRRAKSKRTAVDAHAENMSATVSDERQYKLPLAH
jgi:Flp pilus assembly protein TadB